MTDFSMLAMYFNFLAGAVRPWVCRKPEYAAMTSGMPSFPVAAVYDRRNVVFR
jgi:hypothetical protein